MSDDIPEPDRIAGAPHPRETAALHGQDAAQDAFLSVARGGRLHHGWMLTGPRGVGKATLAWRIARWMIAGQPEGDAGLYIDPDQPAFRRVASLGEPRVLLCRRPWDEKTKKLRKQITVEEVRKLKSFFNMSAADGGWRVAIVDAMDDLNIPAQNALLKILEEPPEKVLFLMVCHQPGRLLPTIRSRCRELRLGALDAASLGSAMMDAGYAPDADTQALTSLSGGSAGEAVRLIADEGLVLYGNLIAILSAAPRMDRMLMTRVADGCAGRGAEERYDLTVRLIALLLNRLSRTGATGQPPVEAVEGEAATLRRLAPTPFAAQQWAELAQTTSARIDHGRLVNLDPAQVILDTFLAIDATARRQIQ
ncbi:DNA polymerase III subunit delta' [Pontivivens nitratireducens]|uniref:DNA polymerase III subunit delta' n=1 Tax=Pontivivens nitratireducens TaxID=2758038 RepID=UPI00163A79DE